MLRQHPVPFNSIQFKPLRWLAEAWWLWIALLALPALWPFYSEGLPRSFDGGLHLLRLDLLDTHIRQGLLLPRWTPSLILGYGYPLYNFYAPGAYYLAETLHLLGLDLYHAFIGAFAIQILLAGWGMYCFAHDLFASPFPSPETADGATETRHVTLPQWAALVAATAYLYGPYLLTNVYIRGAIAEAGAQALLPWIFWGTRRLIRDPMPARYFLFVVATLGTLAITHNITLLFLPPVLLLFALLHWLASDQRWQRLPWLIGAFLAAMGSSAFFWLPLLLERHELAETAYLISRRVWLPDSVWTWQNLLDHGLTYTHTFDRPIKLGLVQLLLAGVGWLAALRSVRRRGQLREWSFWLLATLAIGAFMGAWALPLWLSNDILPVAQFTWRLLSILSLPLALFAGGLILIWPRRWLRWVATLAALTLIIASQRPQLAWIDLYAAEGTTTSRPVFAQIEIDKGVITGGHRNSSIQEFRPRWADTDLVLDEEVAPPAVQPTLTVAAANDFDLALTATAPAATFLRFATFYFPGWEVRLNGIVQPSYPSTNLGLLTVDLPAGTHEVTVQWVGTTVQRFAAYLSLATLLVLVLICGWQRPLRALVLLPALLLFVGTAASQRTLPLQPVIEPPEPLTTAALQLHGVRLTAGEPGYLHIHAYWQIRERLTAPVTMHWQLTTAGGAVMSAASSYPYFNTIHTESWAPGMLMDDAQRLPLPATMAPGHYQLALQLLARQPDGTDQPVTEMQPVARYELTASPPPAPTPQQTTDLRFGNNIRLVGYNLHAAGQSLAVDMPATPVVPAPPVVRAGQYLRTTLFWQADGRIDQNYHAFVHLTDHRGQPLAQEDHLPGPLFHAPQLWNSYRAHTDSYLLRIPADAPSGLYWPGVGVYDFATLERLPLPGSDADRHLLPPLKVWGEVVGKPALRSGARFGDMATLLGYTVGQTDGATLSAEQGDSFTLALYWKSEQRTATDYTRFIQVYHPDLGMAAQFDSLPQQGANPTWAWVPGEVIADQATLTVQPAAQPGQYPIYVGFYDAANGTRLPVQLADDTPVPEAWVAVGILEIAQATGVEQIEEAQEK